MIRRLLLVAAVAVLLVGAFGRTSPVAQSAPQAPDGAFSPDGTSLVFNRHPAVWTRKHYRGAYAADLWVADLAQQSYKQLVAGEQYNRYWPM